MSYHFELSCLETCYKRGVATAHPGLSDLSVKKFDADGKMMKILADAKLKKAIEFKWNTAEISSRIYFLQFDSGTAASLAFFYRYFGKQCY